MDYQQEQNRVVTSRDDEHGETGGQDSVRSTVTQEARALKDEVAQGAKQIRDTMSDQVGQVTSQLRAEGRHLFQNQCDRVADQVASVATAFEGAAKVLHDKDQQQVAAGAEIIAQRMNGAADYIRDLSPSRILSEVNAVARRHPELFLGGLLLAGVAVARLVKAHPASDGQHIVEDDEASTITPGDDPVGPTPPLAESEADDLAEFSGTAATSTSSREF